ncbi:hypothetical protein FNF27_03808 [Cafeteria roenbergensis]|uniref:Uncharacterized protein n=1 Tax=Cafeteria roenbergensis TaxID=33653 RepID=A0A5A8CKE3_CAFRO|nr:hypothetical protein FNF29_03747 [Cafeteria roenbergensis]KAA0174685.1 hypothetical protein FNF27_03808 [Cafeteria roenbergensis]|eukprot:KAA0152520.1 hypothetical protein FNF29_03747 [Cafeteria roenbergensis]
MSAMAARHLTDFFLLQPDARSASASGLWALELDQSTDTAWAVGLSGSEPSESREALFSLGDVVRLTSGSTKPARLVVDVLDRDGASGAPAQGPGSRDGPTTSFALMFASESEAADATAALLAASPGAAVQDESEAALSPSRTAIDCRMVVFRDPYEAHRRVVSGHLPSADDRASIGVELCGAAVLDTRYLAVELWAVESGASAMAGAADGATGLHLGGMSPVDDDEHEARRARQLAPRPGCARQPSSPA